MTLFLFVLLAAFVFEYINGFHDSANAIATVVFDQGAFAPARDPVGGLLESPRRAHGHGGGDDHRTGTG